MAISTGYLQKLLDLTQKIQTDLRDMNIGIAAGRLQAIASSLESTIQGENQLEMELHGKEESR